METDVSFMWFSQCCVVQDPQKPSGAQVLLIVNWDIQWDLSTHLVAFGQPTQLWEVAVICHQIYSYILGPICQEQKYHLQNATYPQLFGFFAEPGLPIAGVVLFYFIFLYRNK